MDPLILAAAATAAVTTVLVIAGLFARPENAAISRLLIMKMGSAPNQGSFRAQAPLMGKRLSAVPLLDFLFARSQRVSQMALDLDRAGLQLRVSEYVAARAVVATLLFVMSLVIGGTALLGFLVAIVIGFLGYLLPRFYVQFRQARRLSPLERQLPEALTIMSNALKAGFGFLQAIDAAAQQMSAPISVELIRFLRDANLGASNEDALRALSERVGSRDLDLVTTAMLIQREVGGNLAEILDNVANTIRERERIQGEIKTITTTQRWEGYAAALVPVALAGLLFLINPDYMMTLFTEPAGRLLLIAAGIWEIIGFFVMKKIVAIEV